jgi:hypothetical protein
MRSAPRCRGDNGAVIVEAALALPIVLFLLLGIADVGNAIFQTSQASSAARDATRAGIVRYLGANDTSSDDFATIYAAIRDRLAGRPFGTPEVTCSHQGTTVGCSTAKPGDYIAVSVEWSYEPVSPFGRIFGGKTIKGVSRMQIVDQAPGTGPPAPPPAPPPPPPPPGACSITDWKLSPGAPLQKQNKNQFTTSYTLTVTTNAAATCTALQVQYNVPTPYKRDLFPLSPPTTWTDTLSTGDAKQWPDSGSVTVAILDASNVVLSGGTFTIAVK